MICHGKGTPFRFRQGRKCSRCCSESGPAQGSPQFYKPNLCRFRRNHASCFVFSEYEGIYGGDHGTRNSTLVVRCANSGNYSALAIPGPLTATIDLVT